MAIKQQVFNQIQGMNRDISPSKRSVKSAYEIQNMRITIQEDNSLLSWENEKGTKAMQLSQTIQGTVVGTCVLNEYLTVFSTTGTKDYIYRLEFTKDSNNVSVKKLYEGNLGFDTTNPNFQFDTIAVFENSKIQKVYWVDGVNQARYINIVDEDLPSSGVDTQFDFLPTDSVNTRIKITKTYETGYFKAGTIQYAFAYFNQNGAQTNLFYITPVQYINTLGIGTETEKSTNCAFKIDITNLNPIFDHIRIYSISRTSQDTDPEAKVVNDIDITGQNSISYTDRGDSGHSIDYSTLLFLNNPRVRPSTLDQKDNTLFLGNFVYDELKDKELKQIFKASNVKTAIMNGIVFKKDSLVSDSNDQYYPYTNQLGKSSTEILGFKGGETYYFGFMLQDKYDRWTSVIPISYKKNNVYPDVTLTNGVWNTTRVVVDFSVAAREISNRISPLDYKNIKFVISTKTETQRDVMCQGVVCPTVYSYEERSNGTIPFAQSSWFFRPIMRYSPYHYNNDLGNDTLKNDYTRYDGHVLEFRHYSQLPSVSPDNGSYAPRYNAGVEIQMNDENGLSASYQASGYNSLVFKRLDDNTRNGKNLFGVDQSILTFHSPDIEFNDTIQQVLDRTDNIYGFRIVGHTVVKNTASDYIIEAEQTSYIEHERFKYSYQTLLNLNKKYNSLNHPVPAACLVSPWGVKSIERDTNSEDEESKETGFYSYMRVFPWNRSSSLNEQPYKLNDGENILDWTIPLKTKVISNLRVCMKTVYNSSPIDMPISDINIFNRTTKLIKIKGLGGNIVNEVSYYGNVDTVLSKDKYSGYRWFQGTSYTDDEVRYLSMKRQPAHMNQKDKNLYNYMGDPIRMKYQSSPHAVFGFKNGAALPYIGSSETQFPGDMYTPCWIQRQTVDNSQLPEINYSVTDSQKSTAPWAGLEETKDLTIYQYYFVYLPEQEQSEDNIAHDLCSQWGITPPSTDGTTHMLLLLGDTSEWQRDNWELIEYTVYNGKHSIRAWGDQVWTNTLLTSKSTGTTYRRNASFNLEVAPEAEALDLEEEEEEIVPMMEASQRAGSWYQAQSQYNTSDDGIFYIGEFYRKVPYEWDKVTEYDLQGFDWQSASDSIDVITRTNTIGFGDTYFQRYDCLKTHAMKLEDPNQIVDIGSFMLETYTNIDGRYDRNRGLLSNVDITEQNFNLLNKAYTQKDKFVQTYLTQKQFDAVDLPSTVMWTNTKLFGETVDSWTKLTSTSVLDLDGDRGSITKIINNNGNLLAFQTDGISQILYNERSQLSTTAGIPVELANTGKVDGKRYLSKLIGCSNKEAIALGSTGVFFVDQNTNSIHAITSEGIKNLSDGTFDSYLNYQDLSQMKVFFNKQNKDIYFINYNDGNALTFNEQLGQFSSFYNYDANFYNNVLNKNVSIKGNTVWEQNAGEYNSFYGSIKPFHMTVVANGDDSMKDKIWNNLEFRADSWDASGNLLNTTFTNLYADNEYQHGQTVLNNPMSNNIPINRNTASTLRKKFRIWRALIPRAVNTRQRIRNPWTYIKLEMQNPGTNKTVLHDEVVYYFE